MENEALVALFEGDPQGSGMRMLARSRSPELVAIVREWFATERRAELARLERDPNGSPRLRPVPDGDGEGAA